MLNNKSVSWLFVIVLAFATCHEDYNSACNNFEGSSCVVLRHCPYVITLITEKEFDKARIRLCGFQEKEPMVCCPKETKGPKDNAIVFNNETEPSATKRPVTKDTIRAVHTTPLPTTLAHLDIFPNRSICGQIRNDDRIIGGQVAGIDEFPWLVRLKFISRRKEYYGCAGSLITNRHVLTAAHCVFRNRVSHVRLGEHNENTAHDCVENECNDTPVDVGVRKMYVHEKYDDVDITRYDIAMLLLEHPVNFTDYIQPVCLPTTEYVAVQDYVKDGSYLTAGWGATEYDDSSPVKRKLRLTAVPIETCQVAFGNINISLTADHNVICAGGRKDEDSCQGDSGGSLVREVTEEYKFNWFIYGVTSFGARKCGEEGLPGAYTRVTAYMDWIEQTVSST